MTSARSGVLIVRGEVPPHTDQYAELLGPYLKFEPSAATPTEHVCSVCSEKTINDSELAKIFINANGTLMCSHALCDECMKSWVKSNLTVAIKDIKCPVCGLSRANIRQRDLEAKIELFVQQLVEKTRGTGREG